MNLHVTDKSNNNAVGIQNSSDILVNPNPQKYVLTKWGDLTVAEKRKPVEPEPVEEDSDELIYEGDGISVLIDTDEFEDEEEIPQGNTRARDQNISSDDDSNTVNLGDSVEPTQHTDVRESHNIQGLNKEEEKLLSDNPHFHSIMSKMLDARLKTLLPNKEQPVSNPGKGKNGKVNHENTENSVLNVNMIKSPLDTTIYAPSSPNETDTQ